jgi:hypothetical protein
MAANVLTASDAQRVPFHCNHFHVKLTGTKHIALFVLLATAIGKEMLEMVLQ